jgi:osmoprotectant transport system ATP-binding protein
MDEPFGATDPITRERLQDEFLRLQQEIKKTIVFVTHDIDEAIKMGDRIAILKQQSKIAQYDTPENILTNPANDFVKDFIGAGASIKRLRLTKVREIETADWPVARLTDAQETVREKIQSSGRDYVLLLDEHNRPSRWVNIGELDGGPLEEAGRPVVAIVDCEASLFETLDAMVISHKGSAVVVNDDGAYLGVVDFEKVLEVLDVMRTSDRKEAPA